MGICENALRLLRLPRLSQGGERPGRAKIDRADVEESHTHRFTNPFGAQILFVRMPRYQSVLE